MAIDYSEDAGGVPITAPIMRISDKGDGFKGTVYRIEREQSVDYETKKPKWFHNGELVLTPDKPGDRAWPVWKYVVHVAADGAQGRFKTYDPDGEPIKNERGRLVLERRVVKGEDICVIMDSSWDAKLMGANRVNDGHVLKFTRLTPERDEDGERPTSVDVEFEIVGKVDDPKPFKVEPVGIDYGADEPVASAPDPGDPF